MALPEDMREVLKYAHPETIHLFLHVYERLQESKQMLKHLQEQMKENQEKFRQLEELRQFKELIEQNQEELKKSTLPENIREQLEELKQQIYQELESKPEKAEIIIKCFSSYIDNELDHDLEQDELDREEEENVEPLSKENLQEEPVHETSESEKIDELLLGKEENKSVINENHPETKKINGAEKQAPSKISEISENQLENSLSQNRLNEEISENHEPIDVKQEKIEHNGETFIKGTWNNVDVIIRQKDGYIKATGLGDRSKQVSKYCASKTFSEICRFWRENKQKQEKNSLSQNRLNEEMKGYYVDLSLSNELKGTYVHPDLIHFVAEHVDKKYAFIVSEITNAINERGKLKGISDEQNLQEILSSLRAENAELRSQMEKQQRLNEELIRQNQNLERRNEAFAKEQEETIQHQEETIQQQEVQIQQKEEKIQIISSDQTKYLFIFEFENGTISNGYKLSSDQSLIKKIYKKGCFQPNLKGINDRFNQNKSKKPIHIIGIKAIYILPKSSTDVKKEFLNEILSYPYEFPKFGLLKIEKKIKEKGGIISLRFPPEKQENEVSFYLYVHEISGQEAYRLSIESEPRTDEKRFKKFLFNYYEEPGITIKQAQENMFEKMKQKTGKDQFSKSEYEGLRDRLKQEGGIEEEPEKSVIHQVLDLRGGGGDPEDETLSRLCEIIYQMNYGDELKELVGYMIGLIEEIDDEDKLIHIIEDFIDVYRIIYVDYPDYMELFDDFLKRLQKKPEEEEKIFEPTHYEDDDVICHLGHLFINIGSSLKFLIYQLNLVINDGNILETDFFIDFRSFLNILDRIIHEDEEELDSIEDRLKKICLIHEDEPEETREEIIQRLLREPVHEPEEEEKPVHEEKEPETELGGVQQAF